MRTITILFLFLFTATTFSQDLKGIELGSKYNDSVRVTTTLCGYDYYLSADYTADSIIYMVNGTPADGENTRRCTSTEIKTIVEAFENKYDIKMRFTAKDEYHENEGKFKASKDGVIYMILITDYNQFKDIPYEMSLGIVDKEGLAKKRKEEQDAANADI